ncbi:hypothetical protein Gotur_019113 [Gossypium turneri]
MTKPSSYSTVTMVIYLIYSMSKRVHNSAPLPRIQTDKAYSRAANVLTFLKRLMSITGINTKKRVNVFALSIYGLVIFPKALGHIDDVASDLFDQLDKRVTPVPTILDETFRSLSACQRAGEGRFIRCVQLLLAWFHSHFWKVEKVTYRELLSIERICGYPKARQHF